MLPDLTTVPLIVYSHGSSFHQRDLWQRVGRQELSLREPAPVCSLPSLSRLLGKCLVSHQAPAPRLVSHSPQEPQRRRHLALINADGPRRGPLSLIWGYSSFFIYAA